MVYSNARAQYPRAAEFEISPNQSQTFGTCDTGYTSFDMTNLGPDSQAQVRLIWTDTNGNPRDLALIISGINQTNRDVYSYGFEGVSVEVKNDSPRSTVKVETSFDYNS